MEKKYMLHAIELAKQGLGYTNPNPMVGAVIVKEGRIIGEGYHHKCGELHAERNAFASLTESAEGADLYVTLEPCCHFGRTAPCTDAIIEHRIARVFIGSTDPNPKVSGKGAKILRNHGIEVIENVCKEECDELNPVFFHYITQRRLYIVMKYAMTLDGKISTRTGKSKWITGEEARKHVHRLRARYAAILCGIGTVLADDPMLFPGRYCMIGDRLADMKVGYIHKFMTVACHYGYGSDEELKDADYHAESVMELKTLLLNTAI